MITISPAALIQFTVDILKAGNVSDEEARVVARSLVGANLRGHDSHGVMRIPYYLDAFKKGEVVPGAPFTVLKETPALVAADGHWGFGQIQARRLMQRVMEKAKTGGVAVGTMIRSTHIGRLGEYCEQAAEAGLVSMMMVNTHGVARRVAPPGGTAPRLGTNPIAFGVPHASEPLVLDFGTSATAEGKVRVKKIAGQKCPDGWLLDNQGRPTDDPETLYGNPPGTIRPMGGDQAYKGFGLGLMIEIFAGALSGGVCIREVPINQNGNCVFVQVYNPEILGGAEHFAGEIHNLIHFMRSCPTIDGQGEITLPGDPERKLMQIRSEAGIPLDDGNWKQLAKFASELGIAPPASASYC